MALRNRRRERRRLCQKAAAEARRKAAHEALTLSALLKDWQALHLSSERPRYAAEAVRALRAAAARRRGSGIASVLRKLPRARPWRALSSDDPHHLLVTLDSFAALGC